MKKLMTGLVFLFVAGYGYGQTVDEVIDKYITALGGKEKLNSIQSVYMEGVAVMQNGNEITSKTWKVNNKLMRREVNFGMGVSISVLTDKEGWASNPRNGNKFEPMTPEMVQNQQSELDCAGPLVDYKSKGHTAELVGKEDVEGTECYKVKLTLKSGRDITYLIDTKSNYVIQVRRKGGGMGGGRGAGNAEQEFSVGYSDYRKTPDGYVFPFTMSFAGMGGGASTNYEKIEVNKPVDPKLYKAE